MGAFEGLKYLITHSILYRYQKITFNVVAKGLASVWCVVVAQGEEHYPLFYSVPPVKWKF